MITFIMKTKIYTLAFCSVLFSTNLFAQDDYQQLIDKAKLHEADNPDSVLFYANKAWEINENEIDATYWMGVGLRYKNELDSALHWYEIYRERATSSLEIGNAHMGIGAIWYAERAFSEALQSFTQAALLFEEGDHKERLAAAYINIGILNGLIGNERKSIAYYLESISIFDHIDNQVKLLPAYVNLAEIYQHQKNYDSSIYFAQKCYDISDSLDLTFAKARALFVLAPSYVRSGKIEIGLQMSIEGRLLFESLDVRTSANSMRYFEAEALFKVNRWKDALNICHSLENSEYSFPEELFWLMSKTYEAVGDYKQSLHYQKKYHEAYETYEKELKTEQVNQLEARYESARKENEIIRLRNEVAIQEAITSRQKWIVGSGVLVVILLMISTWFYYQRRISKEKEQSAIHKQQLLRSQINPHFIFNSLSSIRGFLFDGNDTQPAITYLGKFAKLMRMVLELSSKEWVSLADEIRALELYLEIQQIRFNKAFDFALSIDPSIDTSEIMVPPLTAQPFIENAIEHGLKGIKKDGKVEVICLSEQGKLIFKIQDNGIGIDHIEPRKNHQSRAILIFRERLGIIGRRMNMSFSFDILDIGDSKEVHGTLVTYELPLVKA